MKNYKLINTLIMRKFYFIALSAFVVAILCGCSKNSMSDTVANEKKTNDLNNSFVKSFLFLEDLHGEKLVDVTTMLIGEGWVEDTAYRRQYTVMSAFDKVENGVPIRLRVQFTVKDTNNIIYAEGIEYYMVINDENYYSYCEDFEDLVKTIGSSHVMPYSTEAYFRLYKSPDLTVSSWDDYINNSEQLKYECDGEVIWRYDGYEVAIYLEKHFVSSSDDYAYATIGISGYKPKSELN